MVTLVEELFINVKYVMHAFTVWGEDSISVACCCELCLRWYIIILWPKFRFVSTMVALEKVILLLADTVADGSIHCCIYSIGS